CRSTSLRQLACPCSAAIMAKLGGRSMQRVSLVSALIVIMTGAANAAPTSSLSGNYGVTGTSVCIIGPAGSSFNGLSPPLGCVVESFVVEQKQTFNGGTGTGTANLTETIATFEGATESITFSTTNTVNLDGTWTSQPSGITGTANSGSHSGQTFT